PDTDDESALALVAAADCGTALNPTPAEGQVEGAGAQGYGLAMTETSAWSDGRPQNPNFGDYKLPTVGDMPILKVAFAESYEPSGPFGAKGVGEIGLDAVPAAIANAIYDACGVRITELPITAEKVFDGLQAKR